MSTTTRGETRTVRTWRRSPVCDGTGRNVIPGGFWTFKSMAPPPSRWYCPACGRTVMARLAGQRGHWEQRFTEHPRRGVTKRDWREWKASR